MPLVLECVQCKSTYTTGKYINQRQHQVECTVRRTRIRTYISCHTRYCIDSLVLHTNSACKPLASAGPSGEREPLLRESPPAMVCRSSRRLPLGVGHWHFRGHRWLLVGTCGMGGRQAGRQHARRSQCRRSSPCAPTVGVPGSVRQ